MKRFVIAISIIIALLFGITAYAKPISEFEYVNGIKCKKRQNILTYLFIGVDDRGEFHERENDDDIPGQCDVLALLVIDKAADTYAVIMIDRNTIANVHAISDYDGSDLGTFPMQIALAHTNGNGMEESCEVVRQAVSDLLLGIPIDHYAAVNMDAIGAINHSVGGVTVTIKDDFSKVDPSMVLGETIRLTDEQADKFIRARGEVGDGTNAERMGRQREYIDAIKPMLLDEYRRNVQFPLNLVHSLSE